MATTTHQISWESFEKLSDGDGMHRELIEGELQILPPPKSGHSNVASNAYEALRPLFEQGVGRIYLEAGYRLFEDRRTWIQPDVSFLRAERVRQTASSNYFSGGPDPPSKSSPHPNPPPT